LGRSPSAPMATWVSTNFFDVLGVRSRLGRTFADDDEGVSGRAVISDRLWRARVGGDSSIVGQYVGLCGDRVTGIGVLAPVAEGVSGRAVISDRLWRARLRGDTSIVGQYVELGDDRFTVIGVLAPGFEVPSGTDLWRIGSTGYTYVMVTRLGEGMSSEALAL